jgi:polyisoprenoid-binding protein YceI
MKNRLLLAVVLIFGAQLSVAATETYVIDTKGAHAFIQFKISHLGYSWIYGRFNTFEGSFTTDSEDFSKSKVKLTIDPSSVDTNHAERDKHIRGEDFLNVKKYPDSGFVSTKVIPGKDGAAVVEGDLTLHGVTKQIKIDIKKVGEGKDPWGGYRKGFEGTAAFNPADFGIISNYLAPVMTFDLVLEGVRQ